MKSSDPEFDLELVNYVRDCFGLPPLKPGITTCLMCGEPFESWDIRQNRRCPTCTEELLLLETENEVGDDAELAELLDPDTLAWLLEAYEIEEGDENADH